MTYEPFVDLHSYIRIHFRVVATTVYKTENILQVVRTEL